MAQQGTSNISFHQGLPSMIWLFLQCRKVLHSNESEKDCDLEYSAALWNIPSAYLLACCYCTSPPKLLRMDCGAATQESPNESFCPVVFDMEPSRASTKNRFPFPWWFTQTIYGRLSKNLTWHCCIGCPCFEMVSFQQWKSFAWCLSRDLQLTFVMRWYEFSGFLCFTVLFLFLSDVSYKFRLESSRLCYPCYAGMYE